MRCGGRIQAIKAMTAAGISTARKAPRLNGAAEPAIQAYTASPAPIVTARTGWAGRRGQARRLAQELGRSRGAGVSSLAIPSPAPGFHRPFRHGNLAGPDR